MMRTISQELLSTDALSSFSSSVLFPPDKCIFCDKNVTKLKGNKQSLTKCVTKSAEVSIKLAAIEKSDAKLLCKVQDQDLVAREAMCNHNVFRRN